MPKKTPSPKTRSSTKTVPKASPREIGAFRRLLARKAKADRAERIRAFRALEKAERERLPAVAA